MSKTGLTVKDDGKGRDQSFEASYELEGPTGADYFTFPPTVTAWGRDQEEAIHNLGIALLQLARAVNQATEGVNMPPAEAKP